MKQTTHTLLMVEPVAFGFNEQTARNNYFQQRVAVDKRIQVQQDARNEFNVMVNALRSQGVRVIVVCDRRKPHTPDAVFPNNWISFHFGGRVALYPMFAPSRRAERRLDVLDILKENGFQIREVRDYSSAEKEHRFLEGTGSMVLDRTNRIAYASLSERTDLELFHDFCRDFDFWPVVFHSFQTVGDSRLPVYHTNVMMSVAEQYAVICLEAIDFPEEKERVVKTLERSGKIIVPITEQQMHCFAGNVLQVNNQEGKQFLVISQSAFDSLSGQQRELLEKFNPLIVVPVPTIEQYGGGSVRCMITEVFYPQ